MAESGEYTRRSTDVPASVALAIEEAARDVRHVMRNELAAISTQVAAGTLLATKEHAEVKSSLEALRVEVGRIGPLELRTADLERRAAALEGSDQAHDAAASATEGLRQSMRRTALGLAGLIVAAAGVLVAVLK